jgi:outer membrane lipoprotein-sorting protein
VKSPAIVQRHPALRWLVPFGIACIAGFAITGVLRTHGSSSALPAAVPATLVSAVEHNRNVGFSGTVVSQMSLGLPALAMVPAVSGPKAESSFSGLFDGSHTMQVWYGGRDRQRVAVLGAGDETDLFRNGRDVWQWNSADGVAVHTRVHRRPDFALFAQPAEALTPAALASGALSSLDADTTRSVDDDVVVADRPAYELVLTPHSRATKIGSVRVAIDGATKVPLGVQIYPKGSSSAAIDVAFTSIRFGMPAERNFDFVPPPSATVSKVSSTLRARSAGAVVAGSGWTTVYRLHAVNRHADKTPLVADEFHAMSVVSGHWGKGRIVQSPMLSMLVTKNGRVYAGTVRPAQLYAVAASRSKTATN